MREFLADCEGCRDREEILGAGAWQADALALGGLLFLVLLIAYLQK